MNEILSSQTFLLTLTLAVYLGSMWLYKRCVSHCCTR